MSLPDVTGWSREEAEAALRAAGAQEIAIVVSEPIRGRASGAERVIGQRRNDEVVVLIVAREMTRDDAFRARKDEAR